VPAFPCGLAASAEHLTDLLPRHGFPGVVDNASEDHFGVEDPALRFLERFGCAHVGAVAGAEVLLDEAGWCGHLSSIA